MATPLRQLAPHLVVGLAGYELSESERRLLESLPPAGVILFARNVSSRDQLESLSHEILRVITEASGGMPPLVMADHEGGRISVLSKAIGVPPTQMAVARTGDIDLCRRLYRDTARCLMACGVNAMLGPVADVNTEHLNPVIGTRSFGDDPVGVALFVRETVRAIREAGVAACIKHFPGHGSTVEDSHVALPFIKRAPHELKAIDRPPFGAGIWAGAEMVMMGHIIAPGGTGPATLESGVIVGILREELGFDGVVITDALEMAGIRLGMNRADRLGGTHERSLGEIVELALKAGNDLLLFSRPVEEVYGELELLVDRLGEPAIDPRSARRVKSLRYGLCSGKQAGPDPGESAVPLRRVSSLYREIASRSIEIKRDPRALLPLEDSVPQKVLFAGERSDFENDIVRRFVNRVMRAFDRREGDGTEDMDRELHPLRIPAESALELIEYIPSGAPKEGLSVLFLLNRKPVGRNTLDRLAEDADIVFVTDWPPAADLIGGRSTVVTTFGIYEAVVDEALKVRNPL
jgi:beta-N-acetylhexosaminidase